MGLSPQFWSLIWVTIAITVLSLIVFFIFRKKDPKQAPTSGGQVVIEHVIDSFDNFAEELTGGKLRKAYPYFFTIFVMIAMGSVIGLFGFENPATSIYFTLGLASISFIGIYVVGVVANGLWGFMKHKYKNPLELFTQFAPLLSLSVRLFGSTFAFSVILGLVPILLDGMGMTELATTWPLFSSIWKWVLISGDFALSMIQAYVFMVLTMMYWRQELPEHDKKKSAKAAAKAEAKAAKQKQKTEDKLNQLLKREYIQELNQSKNFFQRIFSR